MARYTAFSCRKLFAVALLCSDALALHTCGHDAAVAREKAAGMEVVYGGQLYATVNTSHTDVSDGRVLTAETDAFELYTASYLPIRIEVIYQGVEDLANGVTNAEGMTKAKVDFLKLKLIPATIERWNKLLSVQRVTGNLFASRYCNTRWSDGTCAGFAAATECGYGLGGAGKDEKIVFTEEQMAEGTYEDPKGTKKTVAGGAGISNADFVMFVTAKNVADSGCPANQNGAGTQAYALTCGRDQYDRPTFGRVNYCPYALSDDVKDWGKNLGVSLHEFAHSLGFTSDSWPLFRNWDANRTPKTPRNPVFADQSSDAYKVKYKCGDGFCNVDVPKENTVDYFAERGMIKCTPTTTHAKSIPDANAATFDSTACVHKHVGSRTIAAAREHFACTTLSGAELENHMTSASFQGSHWEQRIFNIEMMTSFVQHVSPISAVTLAMFEDSGWYRADYRAADAWKKGDWGYKQGCAFATEKCIEGTAVKGDPPHFYTTANDNVCTVDRSGVGAAAALSPYTDAQIPAQYRYFTGSDLLKGGDKKLDFCPTVGQPYSNRKCNTEQTDTTAKYFGITYGSDASRACFETTLRITVDGGSMSDPAGAGCYKYACEKTGSTYSATITAISTVKTATAICAQGDLGTKSFDGFTGVLTCPDIAQLCESPAVLVPAYFVPPAATANPSPAISASGTATALASVTPTPSMTVPEAATVAATLIIGGLTVAEAEAAGAKFTDAVIQGLATVLSLTADKIKITKFYISAARRMMLSTMASTSSSTAHARGLAAGLAVDFTVATTAGAAANGLTSAISAAFVPGNPNAGNYSTAINSLVNAVAVATGKSAASLAVSVDPASVKTTTASTAAGAQAGLPVPAVAGIAAAIVLLVVLVLVWRFCCRRPSGAKALTGKVAPLAAPAEGTAV